MKSWARVFDDYELRNLLEKRNNSILAHGFSPVSEEDCLNLKKKILNLACLLHKDIAQIMEEGKFPDYEEVRVNLQQQKEGICELYY